MQETYIEEILKELTLEEKIGMIHGRSGAAFHPTALYVGWTDGSARRICGQ